MTAPSQSSGIALALSSACAFGLSGTIATPMLAGGWTPAAAVVARLALGAIVLAPWALATMRGRWAGWRKLLRSLVVYAFFAVAGVQFAYFQSVQYIPVAVALLVEYLGIVLVLAWLRFHRRQSLRWATWAGAAVAISGMVLVLQVHRSGEIDGRGIAWALVGAVGMAAYFILAEAGDPQGAVPPPVLAAGGMALGTLGLTALCGLGVLPWATSRSALAYAGIAVPWWVAVLTLGVVSGAIAYATGILTVRRLGPRLASFLALTEVLVATAAAALLLGQALTGSQLLGAAIVLTGIVIIRRTQ